MTYTRSDYTQFAAKMREKYPKMFAGPYGGFDIGPGWWPIIEALCSNIQSHIDFTNKRHQSLLNDYRNTNIPAEVPQVVVGQIKEKFGGLRFYYDGGDDKIRGMVSMAEAWAANICEECGHPGKLRTSGWIKTLCDHHEAERQARMSSRKDPSN